MMMNQNRLRRDLAWCLSSPSLLARERWSEQLAPGAVPILLPQPAHPHRFRLGQQFERLLLVWLLTNDSYQCLYHNLQVNDGKRTVGEFDLIVEALVEEPLIGESLIEESGAESPRNIEHWEAAVKFYLGTADLTRASSWFGPNTADRLDIKLDRMNRHQLRLSQHPVAQDQLRELGIEISRIRSFVKGRLFHPWQAFTAGRITVPTVVNPAHGRGWWISHEDFLRDFEPYPWRYVFLPKSLWLAPLAAEDLAEPLSFFEMAELLASPGTEQASHIAVTGDSGEVHRGFVVNNNWLTRVNDSPEQAGNLEP